MGSVMCVPPDSQAPNQEVIDDQAKEKVDHVNDLVDFNSAVKLPNNSYQSQLNQNQPNTNNGQQINQQNQINQQQNQNQENQQIQTQNNQNQSQQQNKTQLQPKSDPIPQPTKQQPTNQHLISKFGQLILNSPEKQSEILNHFDNLLEDLKVYEGGKQTEFLQNSHSTILKESTVAVNGMKNGAYKLHKENGTLEIGQYLNNLRHGKALVIGQLVQVILYQHDLKTNFVMEVLENSVQLARIDENGCKNGKAVKQTQLSKMYFNFQNDVAQGEAQEEFKNRIEYFSYLNGQRNGKMTVQWFDNSVETANIVNGKREGIATRQFDGADLEYFYLNDQKQGEFKQINKSESGVEVIKANFVDNVLAGRFEVLGKFIVFISKKQIQLKGKIEVKEEEVFVTDENEYVFYAGRLNCISLKKVGNNVQVCNNQFGEVKEIKTLKGTQVSFGDLQ